LPKLRLSYASGLCTPPLCSAALSKPHENRTHNLLLQ